MMATVATTGTVAQSADGSYIYTTAGAVTKVITPDGKTLAPGMVLPGSVIINQFPSTILDKFMADLGYVKVASSPQGDSRWTITTKSVSTPVVAAPVAVTTANVASATNSVAPSPATPIVTVTQKPLTIPQPVMAVVPPPVQTVTASSGVAMGATVNTSTLTHPNQGQNPNQTNLVAATTNHASNDEPNFPDSVAVTTMTPTETGTYTSDPGEGIPAEGPPIETLTPTGTHNSLAMGIIAMFVIYMVVKHA